jgi:hypothetical protein
MTDLRLRGPPPTDVLLRGKLQLICGTAELGADAIDRVLMSARPQDVELVAYRALRRIVLELRTAVAEAVGR